MAQIVVKAEEQRETGSAPSRRLRSAGKVPGILYGPGGATSVSFDAREFRNSFAGRASRGSLVSLQLPSGPRLARIQDLQRHPVRREISHVDFMEIDMAEIITASVGLDVEDGLTLQMTSIDLVGPAGAIPGSLAVTLDSADAEGNVIVSKLALPKSISAVLDADAVVATLTPVE